MCWIRLFQYQRSFKAGIVGWMSLTFCNGMVNIRWSMTKCPLFKSCGTRFILKSLITQFQPEIIPEEFALEELDSYIIATCFLVWWVLKQKSHQGSVGGLGPRSHLVLDQCLGWCWASCPTFSDGFWLWSVLWEAKALTYVSFFFSRKLMYSINTKLFPSGTLQNIDSVTSFLVILNCT